MNLIFFLYLGFSLPAAAAADVQFSEAPEVEIKATALRLRDEVTPENYAVSLDQPSGQVDLAPALRRLPGVTVRDRSGPGSLVTAFQAQSLTSGDSQVSIDELPIINPLGTGVNFSLFPAALIERLDARAAFDSVENPFHDPRPAPGGRINLKTWGARRHDESRFRGGAVYGLYNTGQATAAFRGGNETSYHLVGATIFSTDGAFRYRDPVSQEVQDRSGNDSTGGGGLAEKTWVLNDGGGLANQQTTVSTLLMGSHLDHSLPGSLLFPTKDHEKDDFHLVGARLESPRFFANVAATHTRTGVRGPDPSTSTDDRFYIGFVQAGVSLLPKAYDRWNTYIIIDNEYDWYHSNDGMFHRNITGFTAQAKLKFFDLIPLTIAPAIRQEVASQYSGSRDYRVSALYQLDPATSFSVGYGFEHAYPPLTAYSGYTSVFGRVRPNFSLGVERHRLWTATAVRQTDTTTFYSSVFYDRASNRSTFAVYNDNTAQYVSVPELTGMGITADGQWFPTSVLSLRGSMTVQRAEDTERRRELAYKPRLQSLLSVGVRPWAWLLATVEETYFSRRRISSPDDNIQGESYLAPFISTALRLDAQINSKNLVYFRINNLFDRAGWDSPGHPLAGRSFWLGYSYGQ